MLSSSMPPMVGLVGFLDLKMLVAGSAVLTPRVSAMDIAVARSPSRPSTNSSSRPSGAWIPSVVPIGSSLPVEMTVSSAMGSVLVGEVPEVGNMTLDGEESEDIAALARGAKQTCERGTSDSRQELTRCTV